MKYSAFISEFVARSRYYPTENKILTGTNGLYGEKETVYRTLAHWAVLIQDAEVPQDKVADFVELFMSHYESHNVITGPFKARESVDKDSSNGLIGTAWNVEGIVALSKLIKKSSQRHQTNTRIKFIVENLYSHYKYNKAKGNWPNIIEPCGEVLNIDRTFNHQLWFAASIQSASHIISDSNYANDVVDFIKQLPKNLKKNSVGAIYHTLGSYPHYHKTYLKRIISPSYRYDMIRKEYGYHAFNLLGFVRLFDSYPEIMENVINENLKVVKRREFILSQENNKYGSSYNPVGLELASALSRIDYRDKDILFWLNYHFSHFFNNHKFEFYNSNDIATLNARLYEITYIDEKTKSILEYSSKLNKWSFVEW